MKPLCFATAETLLDLCLLAGRKMTYKIDEACYRVCTLLISKTLLLLLYIVYGRQESALGSMVPCAEIFLGSLHKVTSKQIINFILQGSRAVTLFLPHALIALRDEDEHTKTSRLMCQGDYVLDPWANVAFQLYARKRKEMSTEKTLSHEMSLCILPLISNRVTCVVCSILLYKTTVTSILISLFRSYWEM